MPIHSKELGGTKALVADDDDDMRALVVSALQADGYSTLEVRDGAELLEILERTLDDPDLRPDVLLTDVCMPRLSGLGVLQAMRRAQLSLPVVVMTVFAHDSVRTIARQLGAVGVLHKPFDPDDLLTAVHNARLMHDLRCSPPMAWR